MCDTGLKENQLLLKADETKLPETLSFSYDVAFQARDDTFINFRT